MRIGVVHYPGSNCEQDAVFACERAGMEAGLVWHKKESVDGYDALIIAGGFSYGDYLRCGAIACFSPIMPAIERYASDGGLVLGICNGFQILVESGLLPGALLANDGLKFRCQDLLVKVENTNSPFTGACANGQLLRLNMAHYEGSFFADPETAAALEDNGQVLMRFCGPDGERGPDFNPNGSINDIAAVSNAKGNVMGLMPHPERVMDPALGSADGVLVFESIRRAIVARNAALDTAVAAVREG